MILQSLDRYRDHGLLVLRIGIGVMFMTHGFPKLMAGPQLWAGLGSAMGNFGVTFAPEFWGFMAAFSEFGGGLALIAGFLVRPTVLMMAFTMLVAATMHISKGDGIKGASHAIELGIVFVSLFLIGAGRFSLDGILASKRR